MMKQYKEIKAQYADAILMFRLGDFYEMFGEDAKIASKILGIVLTARDAGEAGKMPMCGVPHHAVESYIATLVQSGYKVAMADQMEDPKSVKGLVKRGVVKVISAGTLMDNVDPKENNFMVSAYFEKGTGALAYCDISTGELRATKVDSLNALIDEIDRISPSECLIPEEDEKILKQLIEERISTSLTIRPIFDYNLTSTSSLLCEQFGVTSLEGFGITSDDYTIIKATGALINYIHATLMNDISHIDSIKKYSTVDFLVMDAATRRNLELTESTAIRLKSNTAHNTLASIIDYTVTSQGGRLLKQSLEMPLIDKAEIEKRHDFTEELLSNTVLRSDVRGCMKEIADLERLSGKLGNQSVSPRELVVLAKSLKLTRVLKSHMATTKSALSIESRGNIDSVDEVVLLIEKALEDEPKVLLDSGGIIRTGYNEQVDELRLALKDGKGWIVDIEAKERERTGIKSLKIGFNHVFGYYIEVTRTNANSVPDSYIRKQTLANAERYITPELKEIEEKVLGAEEKLVRLEREMYFAIRDEVARYIPRIQGTARAIAMIDMIASFSEAAFSHRYTRPVIEACADTILEDARHPVLEERLSRSKVVPNDVTLSHDDSRLIVLTGPNMAGKSTVLSMVGMLTVMAQAGSFVPASYAKIGITDKIFYRTGSYDDIGSGKSTFMVELIEVANIINGASDKSLILIDELGRGTSTYDGMALAWAISEWIHDKIKARTIFTTHYHELAALEGLLSYCRNYYVGAKEVDGELVFLYKLMRGSADKSYGINVARMAGLPKKILKRSNELLKEFEAAFGTNMSQMTLFGWDKKEDDEVIVKKDISSDVEELLKHVNIDDTTPRQALEILSAIKSLIGDEVEE